MSLSSEVCKEEEERCWGKRRTNESRGFIVSYTERARGDSAAEWISSLGRLAIASSMCNRKESSDRYAHDLFFVDFADTKRLPHRSTQSRQHAALLLRES